MAKNLILFGAGASLSANVPIISTFLDAAHKLYSETPGVVTKDAFATVFELVQERLPLLHAKANVDLDNIESVYSLVEMAELLGKLPGTPSDQLASLPNTLRTVIAETVQNTCKFQFDTARRGWLPHPDYGALAGAFAQRFEKMQPPVWTILTFNYDVALDFALLHSGIGVDYGFANVTPTIQRGSIDLLKLHGSLNWGTIPNDTTLRHLNLSVFLGDLNPSRNGSYSWPLLKALRKVQPSNDVEVALAPPSWNKTKYYKSFVSIWRRAAQAISEAENIYIIGYSAPPSDGFFHDLLAIGLQGPTRLNKLWVVNPDPDALARVEAMIGPQIRSKFKPLQATFNGFLAALASDILAS